MRFVCCCGNYAGYFLFRLFCNDQPGYLLVGRLRNDLFLDQLIFSRIGASSHDFLRVRISDARQRFQLIETCGINVQQIACRRRSLCHSARRWRVIRATANASGANHENLRFIPFVSFPREICTTAVIPFVFALFVNGPLGTSLTLHCEGCGYCGLSGSSGFPIRSEAYHLCMKTLFPPASWIFHTGFFRALCRMRRTCASTLEICPLFHTFLFSGSGFLKPVPHKIAVQHAFRRSFHFSAIIYYDYWFNYYF